MEIKRASLDGDLKVGSHVSESPMLVVIPKLPRSEMCVLGHQWVKDFAITYDRVNGRIGIENGNRPKQDADD